jgi:hypothetical protein
MISGGLNLDVSWRAVNATGEATWAAGIGNGGNYVAWDRASGVVIAILHGLAGRFRFARSSKPSSKTLLAQIHSQGPEIGAAHR